MLSISGEELVNYKKNVIKGYIEKKFKVCVAVALAGVMGMGGGAAYNYAFFFLLLTKPYVFV